VSFLPGPARCARRRYTRRSALTSSRRPEKSLVGAAAAVAVAAARAFWDCERRGRRLVALRCGLADADAARQPNHIAAYIATGGNCGGCSIFASNAIHD